MTLKSHITIDEIRNVLSHHPLSDPPMMEGEIRWEGDPMILYRIWDLYNGSYIVFILRGSQTLGAVFENTDNERTTPDTWWNLIWQLEAEIICS